MTRGSLIKHAAKWGLGSASETIAKTIVVFIAIGFLTKEEFGYISAGMLVFSYLTLVQLGFPDALMLRLPKLHLDDRHEDFLKYTATTLYFTTANILVVGSGGIVYMFFMNDDPLMALTLCCYFLSGLIYNFNYHYLLLNKYKYKLNATAVARVVTSAIRLGPQLAALYYFGLMGFLIVESLLFIAPVLLLMKAGYGRLVPSVDKSLVADLFRDAKFLFLVSLFGLLSASADRWLVMISGDLEALATYYFPVFVATAVLFIPSQVLSIFTQYTREMVAKHIPVKVIFEAYMGWTLVLTVVWGCFSIFLVEFSSPLIQAFLPKYNDSIIFIPAVAASVIFRANLAGFLSFYVIHKNYKALYLVNVLNTLFLIGGAGVAYLFDALNILTIAWLMVFSVAGGVAVAIAAAVWFYKVRLSASFFSWIATCLLYLGVCVYRFIDGDPQGFDLIKSSIVVAGITIFAAAALFGFSRSSGWLPLMKVIHKDFSND